MSLGDRIKRYEAVTHYSATGRTPLMVRVDGRAFHTFTKKYNRPFDADLMQAMVSAAKAVSDDMQGFKAAYIQSDEATFCLTDYDSTETQGWFDYDLSKIISITASTMTGYFNRAIKDDRIAIFDSRAFSLPSTDVVNAFLWRAQDWERNSLQMYARSCFTHKELHGKRRQDMHDMLHSIGRNWTTDLSDRERNGTFLINSGGTTIERCDIVPKYQAIKQAIGGLFAYND